MSVDGIAGQATQRALGLRQERGRWFDAVARAWHDHRAIIEAAAARPPEGHDPIPPAAALAVLAVESAGRALGADGLPIARFEVHLIERHLDAATFMAHFRRDSAERWKGHQMRVDPPVGRWIDVHTGGQAREYAAIELAAALAGEPRAYSCASFGAARGSAKWPVTRSPWCTTRGA